VTLDGSRSWSREGDQSYQWTLSDGSTAEGAQVERSYAEPGIYSEILQVTDGSGHVDYDFAIVQVYDTARGKMPPGVHASFAPTLDLKPGDPVSFLVRVFNSEDGTSMWDFGDGSEPVTVHCNPVAPGRGNTLAGDGYAVTQHRYTRPGHYLAKAEHREGKVTATVRLQVVVGSD
jgi:hypothetical protein